MRVYYAGNDRANMDASVTPALDPRGRSAGISSDWTDKAGKAKTIMVNFRHGEANVPDSLGRYLCAIGMAKRTRLIVPKAA